MILQDTTSFIQTVHINDGHIDTIATFDKHFEAPNWHPDNYLIINSKGKLYTLDLTSNKLDVLDSGFADRNNNDHVISPDLKWLGISHYVKDSASQEGRGQSVIFKMPITGGTPQRITQESNSFLHGWKPDGSAVIYTGKRGDNFDIYAIDSNGGKEIRLTTTEGLDDGPEYSPDGKYVYFNSFRTGKMQIWRMQANGSNPEQMTFDQYSNWFPHVSPDGKWIVYISYVEDQGQAHPFGKQVKLRLMDLETREIRDLTPVFFGGQGSINVPSWSPDSRQVAFVSYSVN
ncbi:WD40-like Beta Propeller Repeat [Robiginitalea myxolifaciens]|uniref:WD40-like Beta Propeller Repeat n=1 Tax=Robiginitalea myxolifaciens TaxID=400055 RepID=A0A1I6FY34_9FLAO|nr:transporter [Robiginitalea myxolifaciens]SFR34810.1 WD40-like Beta Propeller Repeat [Robiginitalea myxolifaciens]